MERAHQRRLERQKMDRGLNNLKTLEVQDNSRFLFGNGDGAVVDL